MNQMGATDQMAISAFAALIVRRRKARKTEGAIGGPTRKLELAVGSADIAGVAVEAKRF